MFTLKHLTPSGNESLYEATEVFFTPDESAGLAQPSGTATHSLGTIGYQISPGAAVSGLADGYVYVMNEAGSTVAKYDLGGWATTGAGNQTA